MSLALKSTFLHIEHFNFVAISSLKILSAFNLMLFIGPDKITEQSGLAVRIPSARLVERMSHTYTMQRILTLFQSYFLFNRMKQGSKENKIFVHLICAF